MSLSNDPALSSQPVCGHMTHHMTLVRGTTYHVQLVQAVLMEHPMLYQLYGPMVLVCSLQDRMDGR